MPWRLRTSGMLLVAFALTLASVVTVAVPAGAAAGSDCGATRFRVLFWPNGHPAIKSAGFQAFPPAHLELYLGTGGKFAQQVGYADATTSKVSTTACRVTEGAPSLPNTLTNHTSKATMLVCTFKSSPLVNAAQALGSGPALLLYASNRAAVYAIMKPVGSTLQYDARACKAKPPPR
jgi:hypothetical protein